MTNKQNWWIWSGVTAITLIFLWAIASNAFPALRGPHEWRWTYAVPGQPARHLMGTTVVALYILIIIWWGGRLSSSEKTGPQITTFLLFCTIFVSVLQVGLLAGESPDVVEQLYFRTVSAGSSGFFAVGSIITDPTDFLAHYSEQMPTFPVHPQRYPPGIPLLFYASRLPLALGSAGEKLGAYLRPYQCTDLTLMRISNPVMGTAVLQMSLPLWSGLVIFPLFGLAKRTLGWDTAVWSTALYPLIPSFALWSGRWDQFFPMLTVTAWYLLVLGLAERRWWAIWISGVMLAAATILSFGLIVMLAPMGGWAVLWLLANRDHWTWPQITSAVLLFAVGLFIVWGSYQLLPGPGLPDIWRVSMSFHLGLERSYWTWLGYHLYDFGIFLGLPIALLCLFAFFYALLRMRRQLTALPISFGVGVLLLDLSGTARGEVARVWIFLTPFAVMCGLWGVGRLSSARWSVALLAILLGLQLLTFNAFLRVVNTGLNSVPTRLPVLADIPQMGVRFGEQIYLREFEITPPVIVPGEALMVSLWWQANGRLDTPYTVFNHLVNMDGELVTQQDGMPQTNTLPMTCWQPGEVIPDSYILLTPPDLPAGEYRLLTGLYESGTGNRVPITGTDNGGDVVVVGTVMVRP